MTANTLPDANRDKARQEAEARARNPQGFGGDAIDLAFPQRESAEPVADLAAPETTESPPDQTTAAREEPSARPPKPARGPFDLKRAEMVARFRSERDEADQDARHDADEIRAFAHGSLPPELAPRDVLSSESEAQRRTKLL